MAARAGTLARSILSLLWLRMWREGDYPQLEKQRENISFKRRGKILCTHSQSPWLDNPLRRGEMCCWCQWGSFMGEMIGDSCFHSAG